MLQRTNIYGFFFITLFLVLVDCCMFAALVSDLVAREASSYTVRVVYRRYRTTASSPRRWNMSGTTPASKSSSRTFGLASTVLRRCLSSLTVADTETWSCRTLSLTLVQCISLVYGGFLELLPIVTEFSVLNMNE